MKRIIISAIVLISITVFSACNKDKDETPPVITLQGYDPYTVCVGTPYVDAGATAEDETDGDLTDKIVVTVNVDTSQPGEGTVRYEVSDEAGNRTTAIRQVNVIYCR